MGVHSTEDLLQPFTVSERPFACFVVINNEAKKMFLSRGESALYSLDASRMGNCVESFDFVHGLRCSVTAALRAFSINVLKDFHVAVLHSELYSAAAKKE